MEPTINPVGWLLIISFMLIGAVLVWGICKIMDRVEEVVARRAALRILKTVDQSEILAARCRVLDARRHRTE